MNEEFVIPLDRPTDSLGIAIVPELTSLSFKALKRALKAWAIAVGGEDAALMIVREGNTDCVCIIPKLATIQWKVADSLEETKEIVSKLREYFVTKRRAHPGIKYERVDTKTGTRVETNPIVQCALPTCKEHRHSLLKKCGRCTQVYYCSVEHQTAHWKTHKPTCKKITA